MQKKRVRDKGEKINIANRVEGCKNSELKIYILKIKKLETS